MEIKNLLKKFSSQPEDTEHFFALEMSDDIVKCAVWTVEEGRTKVVKIGPAKNWDGQNKEDLLGAVDQTLSAVTENLEVEPNGVVFGLPESWLDTDGINPDKKQLLKFLSQELDLKALGFVVTDTALIAYLKIEEGAPPNAIFLQIGTSEINVTLVKMGKTIGAQLVGRSDDLGADVEEGLSRFDKIDTLPARMILYDGKRDFEEDKQQLISYAWEEKLPFIHFPKVEAMSAEATIKAVALAGGSEVAKSLGFDIKPPEATTAVAPAATAASLGFVSGKDAAEDLPQPQPEPEPDQQAVTEKAADDVQKISASERMAPAVQLIKQKVSGLKTILTKFKSGNKLIWLGVGFGLLLTGLILAYWYVPRATVTLVVQPQTLDEALTVTIDPTASTLDPSRNVLPGQSVDIDISGSKTLPTTGATIVGDPASGEVTIYNKTSFSRTFESGTILIGSNNLAFSLDDDTTIASASAGTEATTYGKTIVSVTAASIGPDGNLSGGTTLSFQQFADSDYSALVNEGLSGGTAREVKAVSQEDVTQLTSALLTDLQAQATQQLASNLGEGRALVDIANENDLSSLAFNHKVGEEADSLKLDAELSYRGLSYREQDLQLLLEQAIREKVPQNFQLSTSSETDLQPASVASDGSVIVRANFKARLIPKLDFTEIKNNLRGRYPNLVEDYLAQLPSFVRADINITPVLPKPLKTLPRVSKNIFIEVKTEQ